MEMKDPLYPTLPLAPQAIPSAPPNIYSNLQNENDPNTFRLQKINEIQKLLEQEVKIRSQLAKKYQRGINVLSGISYALEFSSVALGATGIGLLNTVVAAPVVIAMEGLALGAGALSASFNLISD